MRLAQLDRDHAVELLETALRSNPFNAQANIELGLRYEADGDPDHAEKLLLQAFEVDKSFRPRWSLANFYLRRNNMPAFWYWARQAAEMPSEDMGALFALCWRVSPDADTISNALPNGKPEVNRQYLKFLLARDQLAAAPAAASLLIRTGAPDVDREQLLSVVNRLILSNQGAAASELWRQLIQQNWVFSDTALPYNGRFARAPLPARFDWALAAYPGLHSWPGNAGLETEFTGEEPDSCAIAEQYLLLTPGNYRLRYLYRTADIPPGTGITWQVIDAKSGDERATSTPLSSDTPKEAELTFKVAPGASLLRVRLGYQRTFGTPRVSGTLVTQWALIEASR
jgi:hypothetical protein